MRKISGLFIILVLACCFVFFKYEGNDAINIAESEVGPQKAMLAPQENTAQHLFQGEQYNENSTGNINIPTPDDIDNRFSDVGSSIDFVEKINQLLKTRKDDKTGATDIKIAKILEVCDNTPKNDIELQQQKKNFENFASDNGRDNGQFQDGLTFIEQQYQSCLDVRSLVSGKTAYDYYKYAADAGQPIAKVNLATRIAPPNYDSFSKENKTEYQQKMGKLLNEAREKCEPTAFLAFGYARDALEQYKLWTYSEDVSPEMSEYGNFVAYILFYLKKTSGGEEVADRYRHELKLRYPNFAQYEIESAVKYGTSLYNKYCENN